MGEIVKTYSVKDGQFHTAKVISRDNTYVECLLDNGEIVYRRLEGVIKEKVITKEAFLRELRIRINDLLKEYEDWIIKED